MDTLSNPTEVIPSVQLIVTGIGHCPSKKNKHYSGINGRILMDKKTKARMQSLESAILSELYSASQIRGNETHLECLKRLRTLLSSLCDDSIREIPAGSWAVEYVEKGQEGAEIIISTLP